MLKLTPEQLAEAQRLYVEGEAVEGANGAVERKVWTFAALGKRYDCSTNTIRYYADRLKWTISKEIFQAELDRTLQKAKLSYDPKARVRDIASARLVALAACDAYIDAFVVKLAAGDIEIKSEAGLNTIARLREFLAGSADQRSETLHVVSIEQLQERHASARRLAAELDEELTGVVVEDGRQGAALPAMRHATRDGAAVVEAEVVLGGAGDEDDVFG